MLGPGPPQARFNTHSTKLPMAARGLHETYRSRLRFSALRMARITLESEKAQIQARFPRPGRPSATSPNISHSRRPARGGSKMATSCWEASLLTTVGTRSSALPQWNSTLLSSGDAPLLSVGLG